MYCETLRPDGVTLILSTVDSDWNRISVLKSQNRNIAKNRSRNQIFFIAIVNRDFQNRSRKVKIEIGFLIFQKIASLRF